MGSRRSPDIDEAAGCRRGRPDHRIGELTESAGLSASDQLTASAELSASAALTASAGLSASAALTPSAGDSPRPNDLRLAFPGLAPHPGEVDACRHRAARVIGAVPTHVMGARP